MSRPHLYANAGRVGTPQDMAGAVLYLCSRAGEYITGASIVVDGGTIVMPRGAYSPANAKSRL